MIQVVDDNFWLRVAKTQAGNYLPFMDYENVLRHTFPSPPYFQSEHKVSARDIHQFLQSVDLKSMPQGKVHKSNVSYTVAKNDRQVKALPLEPTGPLFEMMWQFAMKMNDQHWQFQNPFINPEMQFASYSKGDFYQWHTDGFPQVPRIENRLISVVALLSSPNSYSGGRLEIKDWTGKILKPRNDMGQMIAFTSCQPHRVSPVEFGTRHSLILWISGS